MSASSFHRLSALSIRRLVIVSTMLSAIGPPIGSAHAQEDEGDPYLGIPEGGGPIVTGPVPEGLTAIDAASCGECHEAAYREWARSRHRHSSDDALYLREFEVRRPPFCTACHSPRPEASADGVDCASCHVRDGAVLSAQVSGRAPHRSRLAPELDQPLACARCHEFDFEHQPGERLQRTLTEWSVSDAPLRGQTCSGCHFPATRRRRAHDLAGLEDPARLRRAIAVTASATYDGSHTHVVLRLRARDVGHAVPTGDMFRNLEVRTWPSGRPADADQVYLARQFAVNRRGWHERADDRIPPRGERVVELWLPDRVRSVGWSVDLRLTSRRRAAEAGWPDTRVTRRLAQGTTRVQFPSRPYTE